MTARDERSRHAALRQYRRAEFYREQLLVVVSVAQVSGLGLDLGFLDEEDEAEVRRRVRNLREQPTYARR